LGFRILKLEFIYFMPYLSRNYRSRPKSKIKGIVEAGKFLGLSVLAIMLTLFLLGWVAFAAQGF